MKKSALSLRFAPLFIGAFSFLLSCSNDTNKSSTSTDTTSTTTTTMDTGTTTDTARTGTAGMQSAVATLSGVYPDTTVSGTAHFTQGSNGKVKLHLELIVPKKATKEVAVHLHESASCDDHGKMAGGHWNPTGEKHGKWGMGAYHSGDIGNVMLDGNGRGVLELETDRWSIGGDAKTDILNKSVIVHSGVDDYTSQPAGNSGNRIGCGVIKAGGQ